MVVGHFRWSFDAGFTKPPPQDATGPLYEVFISIFRTKIAWVLEWRIKT
jgi:hypothetical protein